MEFYELLIFGAYFGQQILNVFNLTLTGTPATVTGSFAVTAAFGAVESVGVFPAGSPFRIISDLVSTSFVFDKVRVVNPYDLTDFYTQPFPTGTTGGAGGSPVSPAVAYGLHSSQVRLDIRSGQKRFAGVTEDNMENGGVVGTSMLALLQDLCDAMSAPMTYDDEGTTLTVNIVVASKPTPAEEPTPAYGGYWGTLTEQTAQIASGGVWTPHTTVRTQTTRQYGRGR